MLRVLFKVLDRVAEVEADLIKARTRQDMAVAKVDGELRCDTPKLNKMQGKRLAELHRAGIHIAGDRAEHIVDPK